MYVTLCRSVSGAARLRSMWGRRRDPDSPLYSLVCLVCLKLQADPKAPPADIVPAREESIIIRELT